MRRLLYVAVALAASCGDAPEPDLAGGWVVSCTLRDGRTGSGAIWLSGSNESLSGHLSLDGDGCALLPGDARLHVCGWDGERGEVSGSVVGSSFEYDVDIYAAEFTADAMTFRFDPVGWASMTASR